MFRILVVALLAMLVALAIGGCTVLSRTGTVSAPPAIVAQSVWGGMDFATTGRRHKVTHLTVHHQGERWLQDGDVPAYLRRLQMWSRSIKGWSDVPYHYIIGPDGTIYAGREPTLAGDTNTEYNPEGHVQVMLLGNFEEQMPTTQQLESTISLLALLLKTYNLHSSKIGAHLHFSAQTVCPGTNLMKHFSELQAAAARTAGHR